MASIQTYPSIGRAGACRAAIPQLSHMRAKNEIWSSILTCFNSKQCTAFVAGPSPGIFNAHWLVRQVRARQAAAHEAVDWLYPASAALVLAATELLADDAIPWSPAVLEQVCLSAGCPTVTSTPDSKCMVVYNLIS